MCRALNAVPFLAFGRLGTVKPKQCAKPFLPKIIMIRAQQDAIGGQMKLRYENAKYREI